MDDLGRLGDRVPPDESAERLSGSATGQAGGSGTGLGTSWRWAVGIERRAGRHTRRRARHRALCPFYGTYDSVTK